MLGLRRLGNAVAVRSPMIAPARPIHPAFNPLLMFSRGFGKYPEFEGTVDRGSGSTFHVLLDNGERVIADVSSWPASLFLKR